MNSQIESISCVFVSLVQWYWVCAHTNTHIHRTMLSRNHKNHCWKTWKYNDVYRDNNSKYIFIFCCCMTMPSMYWYFFSLSLLLNLSFSLLNGEWVCGGLFIFMKITINMNKIRNNWAWICKHFLFDRTRVCESSGARKVWVKIFSDMVAKWSEIACGWQTTNIKLNACAIGMPIHSMSFCA